jgi:uncharacterized damage-inducible protein DinB
MRTLLIAALAVSATVSLRSAELTPVERSHLVAHLEMTRSWLIDEVSSLSQEQLAFRASSGVWSIMEVLEHLVVVGPIYWNDLQQAVKGRPGKRLLTTGDADILWYGIDRTRRETAIPSEKPPGRLRDIRTALKAYRTQHAQLLDYARTTKDDLRSRVVDRQGCDAYQWALLISTHEQRHVLQIREIKAHPSFPGK